MQNKTITMYELIGLIKDDKAPKEIKYYEVTYEFNVNNYYLKGRDEIEYSMFYKLAKGYMFLNDKVEIPEENNEWVDIKELAEYTCTENYTKESIEYNRKAINKLIKNQRKIIEKLDKNEIMFDYYVEKLEAKEKLEVKDEN